MSTPSACCTCASLLGVGAAPIDDKTEKPLQDLSLSCCGRIICARCVDSNPRLATYCPFCQKTRLDRLPSAGEASAQLPPPYTVDDPDTIEGTSSSPPPPPPPPQPAYSELARPPNPPPSYNNAISPASNPASDHNSILAQRIYMAASSAATVAPESEEDVTHYLAPQDSLASISLAYGVPIPILRSHNKLHSDHLLSARRKIAIPRSHYRGPSLSPHPVEGEEESERKARLRRFMVKCKCVDYKVATLYLEEHEWDLEGAVNKWWDDERWEKEHPVPKNKVATSR